MGIPSIAGHIGGGTVVATISRDQYKYVPYHTKQNIFKSVTVAKKPKSTQHDVANLVILGGPFEKIGEKDESFGGGNQKVGQDIQR